MKLPKSKIEERALSALREIIDKHSTMQPEFHNMDKEMSWDGYIWIFCSETDRCKESYDDKVPVQIKGRIDHSKKYLNKKKINYSVDLADLRVYFKSTGVLYFLIFMTEDGKEREIFYASLFPSKIKAYLENAEKSGNNKFKSIPFTKLEKSPECFYITVKQFSTECKKQGFGDGPVVQSTITEKDMDKVETITASAVGVSNEHDFLEKLSSGDVCMYANVKGSSIPCPIKWDDDPQKVFTREAEKSVEIKRTVTYIFQ